ncbi:MAG: S8 family serine peptidase [Proteobacteria bacterium]|nr:S8 family serine peptidase [Pseudomonadota bacterium]
MTKTTQVCAAVGLAIAALGASAQTADTDTTRVVVSFKPGSKLAHDARALMAKMGGQVKVELAEQDAVAIVLPKRMLAQLRKHGAVASVDEDAKRYLISAMPSSAAVADGWAQAGAGGVEAPTPKRENTPYGIKMVQAGKVPASGNAPLKVCIIDSGLDREHPDMIGNEMTGEYDSVAGNWYDVDLSHGTHVAGTIAALKNGAGVVGVNGANEVALHIVKVFTADGWTYSSTLSAAANKCKAAGAKVINMSLGGPLNNPLEERTFNNLEKAGILSIAAAGNDGNTAKSYPASYASVMSVAAVDKNKAWASFSQYNNAVEIAGPGVAVLSDVARGDGRDAKLKQGTTKYAVTPLSGSATTTAPVTAALFDLGLGDATNTAAAGKHCLIQRGSVSFADKVKNCEDSGGLGAIIYNNVPGGFAGTLGGLATTIPSVSVSDTDGAALMAVVGQNATMSMKPTDYELYDGTSMATPHVVGVAAKVWRHFPQCTGKQIRDALNQSALDIGDAGRDNKTGYGLVQARAAYDRLLAQGCGA